MGGSGEEGDGGVVADGGQIQATRLRQQGTPPPSPTPSKPVSPPYNGNIDYVATSGHHLFYTGVSNERMRISNDSNVISTGYIYAGVPTTGLRINGNDHGSTIYQNATSIKNGNPANIGIT